MEVADEVARTTTNDPAVAGVDPGRIRLQGPQNRSLRSPNPNRNQRSSLKVKGKRWLNRMFPRAATRPQPNQRLPIRLLATQHSQTETASQLRPEP